ncbi:hypothetical protein EV363DRAFT_1403213 [Boletus edulis]|nr:hypothetical protein EV363DRAFT_1403213 [Boletus edulis]
MSTSPTPRRAASYAPSPSWKPTPKEPFHSSPVLILNHHTSTAPTSTAQINNHRSPCLGNLTQHHFNHCPTSWSPIRSVVQNNDFQSTIEDDDPPYLGSDLLHTFPFPCNSREAYLLLETARTDRRILLARKTLAHQIIHRNMVVLQYNRMVLDKTVDDLRAAETYIGHVCLMIREGGQTAAFEYAMQQDYSACLSGNVSSAFSY